MGTLTNNKLEEQIIETARQLFVEKGFSETSMSDIAARVGINRPTLHYYFRTKERMFQAVFGSIVVTLLPKVQQIIRLDLPIMERISLALDEYIDCFTRHPEIPKFVCGEIYRDMDRLYETLQFLHLDEVFSEVKHSLLAEMEAGRLKSVPLHIVFPTFYGLVTFPFLAHNLMIRIFLEDESRFEPFLKEWKQYVIFQLRNLLLEKDS